MCHEAALETTLKKKQVYQPTTNTSLVCDWARSLPPLSYPDVWRFLPPSPPQAVEAGREGPGRRSAHQRTGAGAGSGAGGQEATAGGGSGTGGRAGGKETSRRRAGAGSGLAVRHTGGLHPPTATHSGGGGPAMEGKRPKKRLLRRLLISSNFPFPCNWAAQKRHPNQPGIFSFDFVVLLMFICLRVILQVLWPLASYFGCVL